MAKTGFFENFIKLFDEEEFLKSKKQKIEKKTRILNAKLDIIKSEKALKLLNKQVEKEKSESNEI